MTLVPSRFWPESLKNLETWGRLALGGIHDRWTTIRHKLEHWDLVSTQMRTVAGRLIATCQDTTPGQEAAEIPWALGVEPRPLRRQS